MDDGVNIAAHCGGHLGIWEAPLPAWGQVEVVRSALCLIWECNIVLISSAHLSSRINVTCGQNPFCKSIVTLGECVSEVMVSKQVLDSPWLHTITKPKLYLFQANLS